MVDATEVARRNAEQLRLIQEALAEARRVAPVVDRSRVKIAKAHVEKCVRCEGTGLVACGR